MEFAQQPVQLQFILSSVVAVSVLERQQPTAPEDILQPEKSVKRKYLKRELCHKTAHKLST